MSRKIIFASIQLVLMMWTTSAFAINRYVATTGNDAFNDCTSVVSPCLTLLYTITQSLANDVIIMAAGTYSFPILVTVDRPLTITGAQAGVDARNRFATETILDNAQGIYIAADNVVFDGFTISGSTQIAPGYGIWINPAQNGTQIINNIIRDNIVGLALSNAGASQALVQHNAFIDNNQPGLFSGTAIYTNQLIGGAVSNVLINENDFENNDNGAIIFANSDPMQPISNITIVNNAINNGGRGIVLSNTLSSFVNFNTVSNLTVPTDGGPASAALLILGGVQNLTARGNNFSNGPGFGIGIDNIVALDNNNLAIHENNITGFVLAGMNTVVAPTGTIDYATCNWWGAASGPFNPILNPGGTGDAVIGVLVEANFNPWLLAPAPEGLCGEGPSVTKSFSPSTVYRGQPSTLTITLINPSEAPAALTAPFEDKFPSALDIVGKASTTCGGTLTAVVGSSKLRLTGGTIPANGSCTIKVKVQSCIRGNFTNVIEPDALQTDQGNNQDPSEATLTVRCARRNRAGIESCDPY